MPVSRLWSRSSSCANTSTDPEWCVIDVRHDLMDAEAGARAYEAGHIPGAAFAHIDNDLSGRKTGRNGRHPLPERADLVQAFRRWGVNDDTQIVAYDANGGNFAVRLWWLARWLGHTRGRRPRWRLAAVAREDRAREHRHAGARAGTVHRAVVLDAAGRGRRRRCATSDRTNGSCSTRALPERFRGEQEPIDPVAGHIPGARNRPWQRNLATDQTFKSAQALRQEFEAALGSTPPVACGPPVRVGRDGVPQPARDGNRRPARLGALCGLVERVDRGPGPAGRDRRRKRPASARARCRWRAQRSPRRAVPVPLPAVTCASDERRIISGSRSDSAM